MKKVLLFIAAIVLAGPVMFGQVRNCGTQEHEAVLKAKYPGYEEQRAAIEDFTNKFVARQHSEGKSMGGVTVTIPIVFHVVYKTAAQNIPDDRLLEQISILNEDFRRLNADTSDTPFDFKDEAADCGIEFCLAQVDPAGNPTTGILRVSTTVNSFGTDDAVKFTADGGDDAWPADSYLNFWVCNLGASLLGYAQFPGGPAATDGVVIHYNHVGLNDAGYPYHLGRTATHEIGHWLNLRHIWGDDGTACTGSDLVGDTPNQADEHYGCATFPAVSCSNGPNGDMFMNYMDYSDDRCMYMFTTGQKDRMQATLKTGGSRNSVTTSGKCGAQPPQFIHTSAASINVVPNPVVSGVANVTYKLENAANIQLLVSDMYGNAQKNINIGAQTAGSYNIQPAELSQLKDGVYLIKLIANGEEIATTRFMVSR